MAASDLTGSLRHIAMDKEDSRSLATHVAPYSWRREDSKKLFFVFLS